MPETSGAVHKLSGEIPGAGDASARGPPGTKDAAAALPKPRRKLRRDIEAGIVRGSVRGDIAGTA